MAPPESLPEIQFFDYTINHPSLCLQFQEVFLLIAVRTIFRHFDRRMAIRDSWGDRKSFLKRSVPVIFLLGATDNPDIQRSIERENMVYKDIIQESFLDSPENATLKTAMAHKWASKFCPSASFVLVANDNVVIDPKKLLKFLEGSHSSENKFAVCHPVPCCANLKGDELNFYNHIKSQNPGVKESPVCSEVAYAAPINVVDKLFVASQTLPPVLPGEVWTGVLAQMEGIRISDTSGVFGGHRQEEPVLKVFMAREYLAGPTAIGVVKDAAFKGREAGIMRHLWRIIQEQHERWGSRIPRPRSDSLAESNSMLYTAISFMLVDLLVVAVIFFLIFCRKRTRKCCPCC